MGLVDGAWVGPGGNRSWWKNGGKLPDLRPQEVEARDEMPKASPSGFGNEAPPEPYAHFEAIRQAQKDWRKWRFLWRLGDMQVMRLGGSREPLGCDHIKLIRMEGNIVGSFGIKFFREDYWCAEAYARITFLFGMMHLLPSRRR